MSPKLKHRIETMSHYLTGFLVLLKAYDKSEHYHEHPVIVICLFVLGTFIIVATIFHHFLEKQVKEFKTLLHCLEFIILLFVAYYYWDEGKKGIPIMYLIAAIANLIAGIVLYKRKIKELKTSNI